MKEFKLLIWLTQLGLSVAVPPAGFIFLGVWLHTQWGWGIWTIWCGIIFGLIGAVSGLRTSLQAMEKMSRGHEQQDASHMVFNNHT